mgnify:CR=1 FL=1
MREIGGFIELGINYGHEFHENCIALNNGRNCLRYLIRVRNIKEIWLPKLLCSAISDTCNAEGVKIVYYSIDDQLRPILPSDLGGAWLYLINYYGQLENAEIIAFEKQYSKIIVDNAQAFYSKPIGKIDTIYTCRKFFGVSDGGYLYTELEMEDDIQQDESHDRIQFLAGRLERTAQEFYSKYRRNEEIIDKLPLKLMSKTTHNLLRCIDYGKEAKIREENFKYLHQHLKCMNKIKVILPVGPYMYPLYIKNGAYMRKKLQAEKIYIPLLWPNVKQNLEPSDREYQLANNILPLPCDQRYSLRDMEYILQKIKRLENL